MRTAIYLVIGIIVGGTLGGSCAWAINSKFGSALGDPENFWFWGVMVGAVLGAVIAMAIRYFMRRPRGSRPPRSEEASR